MPGCLFSVHNVDPTELKNYTTGQYQTSSVAPSTFLIKSEACKHSSIGVCTNVTDWGPLNLRVNFWPPLQMFSYSWICLQTMAQHWNCIRPTNMGKHPSTKTHNIPLPVETHDVIASLMLCIMAIVPSEVPSECSTTTNAWPSVMLGVMLDFQFENSSPSNSTILRNSNSSL